MTAAWRSLLFSVVAITVYWALGRIPNPFLTAEAMSFLYGSRAPDGFSRASFGPFVLGIGPALSGFFLVELLSFFLPPFSRWRKLGFAGRARLNYASVALSFLVAIATTYFLVRQMISMSPGGNAFLDGSLANTLGCGAFFLGGFALVFLGANLLTVWGLGNGFGLLLLAGAFIRVGEAAARQYYAGGAFLPGKRFDAWADVWPLLLSLVILAFFYTYLFRRRMVSATGDRGNELSMEISPVHQGLLAWSFAWQLAALFGSLALMGVVKIPIGDGLGRFYTFFVFFLVSNLFLYWIDFSPKRLENAAFGRVKLAPGASRVMLETALLSFIVIAALELLAFLPHPAGRGQSVLSKAFDVGSLVLIFILAQDLWRNFKFLRDVKEFELLGEFDNPHLLSVVRATALADGRPVYLKGHTYRQLMGFFQPLVKMHAYVPRGYAPILRQKLAVETVPVI